MRTAHRVINKENPKAHFEMLALPNCIYLSDSGGCAFLHSKQCKGLQCRFLHTKEEIAHTHDKWCARLSSLDEERQRTIADKYYGGTMPWKIPHGLK